MGVSRKLRFEVFKRDKFTCQYCGSKSPDVVLEADHIHPKSKGGTDDILNLITSCFDCNRGKRDTPLSDSTEIDKQRAELENLENRRQQIEMMIEWRRQLTESNPNQPVYDFLVSPYNIELQQHDKVAVDRMVKKYGEDSVIETAGEIHKSDFNPNNNSIVKKLSSWLSYKNSPPHEQKIKYLIGVAKNKLTYCDTKKTAMYMNKIYEANDEYAITFVTTLLKSGTFRTWTQFRDYLENCLKDNP